MKNNKIFLTTYITYKKRGKKMKKKGQWASANDTYCKWRWKGKLKNKHWNWNTSSGVKTTKISNIFTDKVKGKWKLWEKMTKELVLLDGNFCIHAFTIFYNVILRGDHTLVIKYTEEFLILQTIQ